MSELMNQNQYAEYRGVTRQAVHKAIGDGRITLTGEGKIDATIADRQWDENTNHAKSNTAMSMSDGDNGANAALYNYQDSRAKREHHEANMAEMRERERSGELCEVTRVVLALTEAASQVRVAVERLPDKLSDRLAAESDPSKVYDLLNNELGVLLDDLADHAEQLPDTILEARR